MLGGELVVAPQIEVALLVAGRKQIADLRADTGDLRFEIAEDCAFAAVAGKLPEEIAGEADLELGGQELRRAPVDVAVDAVLIVGVLDSRNCR